MKIYFKKLFAPLAKPVAGFDDYREKNFFPLIPTLVVLILFILSKVAEFLLTGFVFNLNNIEKINMFFILFETVGIFVFWVGCNWAVSTLIDGKGKLREIWAVTSIAILPHVIATWIKVLLSNFLLMEEGTFLTWISAIGLLYSAFLLLSGLSVIHEYTFTKVIISSVLTVAFIAVILFVCVLLFSLFQQVFGFSGDLWEEIMFRI